MALPSEFDLNCGCRECEYERRQYSERWASVTGGFVSAVRYRGPTRHEVEAAQAIRNERERAAQTEQRARGARSSLYYAARASGLEAIRAPGESDGQLRARLGARWAPSETDAMLAFSAFAIMLWIQRLISLGRGAADENGRFALLEID